MDKGVEVVTDAYGNKAVKVDYIDPTTGELSKANIPYDSTGLAIFDDVAKYITTITKPEGYEMMTDAARRTAEMKQATLDLKDAINSGKVNANQFTAQQLYDIQSGSDRIFGYTWHHNAQSAPNNMQLVPYDIHKEVTHIGEASLSKGK
ncbi:HNH endonuclease [Sulfurospirillum multivorans]|uniref:Colicin-DNase domain-containing protein n=2 Tax=Sulfurospirillum multivorans TaxID=66821 RepID=A0AA86AN35_SULMK|nr:HNH endonuclease [Sulfurospirillum multivorans]AHJ13324.1 colicin-DNase domain-containing protein [Sulfurospirillum multivorans DSM 12446]QEH06814.1 colicin-DNase domain-containing protein [Sulfurospirillum multivorans]